MCVPNLKTILYTPYSSLLSTIIFRFSYYKCARVFWETELSVGIAAPIMRVYFETPSFNNEQKCERGECFIDIARFSLLLLLLRPTIPQIIGLLIRVIGSLLWNLRHCRWSVKCKDCETQEESWRRTDQCDWLEVFHRITWTTTQRRNLCDYTKTNRRYPRPCSKTKNRGKLIDSLYN